MSENVKLFAWGEHPMTLRHPWVRSYIRIRGLPGEGGSTPADCFQRFSSDRYTIDDIERVYLLGLVGGGMTLGAAQAIVDQEIAPRPLLGTAPLAMGVLSTLFGDIPADAEATA